MPAVAETLDTVQSLTQGGYKWGFESDIETDLAPKGLNEDIVRLISERRGEPEWLLEWRLKAYRHWLTMEEPNWGRHVYERVDYQALHYYASPKKKAGPTSLDEVDPELLRVYEKLGIPLKEQAILAGVEPKGDQGEQNGPDIGAALARSSNIAVDAVFDSVSVATTFQKTLRESGVIFCPISEAVREHPELVRQYLGSVVPAGDNFFAALNSAVFTDGSFAFIPKGVRCPMELSTYFRINARNTGQFERTLIIAEEGASCPTSRAAPRRSATRTSCTPPWSSWWRSTTPPSSTAPCRTGIPATRRARAACTTSSPSARPAAARAPR